MSFKNGQTSPLTSPAALAHSLLHPPPRPPPPSGLLRPLLPLIAPPSRRCPGKAPSITTPSSSSQPPWPSIHFSPSPYLPKTGLHSCGGPLRSHTYIPWRRASWTSYRCAFIAPDTKLMLRQYRPLCAPLKLQLHWASWEREGGSVGEGCCPTASVTQQGQPYAPPLSPSVGTCFSPIAENPLHPLPFFHPSGLSSRRTIRG